MIMAAWAILVTVLAASLPLEAATVYWASTSNIDYSALGSWLTLTGYTLDLKTTAPEGGSDPALLVTADSYRAFVPAYANIPGERLLTMREGPEANADLITAGPELAAEPKLIAQTGAAPNAGTLTMAAVGGGYGGPDGASTQMGFGPLTISRISRTVGDLEAGRKYSTNVLIVASEEGAGTIRAVDGKAADQR
jgi:hypothetical protein